MTVTLSASPSMRGTLPVWPEASNLLAQWLLREKTLTLYALAMAAIAMGFVLAGLADDRLWRGAPIWSKPAKFAVATTVFALTTAWWIGLLPVHIRQGSAVQWLVWTLIVTATFEVVYIGLQAALGQGSHHNTTDRFHTAMFALMGAAALALTATQAALAVLIARHHVDPALPQQSMPPEVLAVVLGLWMTFVLGTVSGMALGGAQPPAGPGLPILGWQLTLQDLRPAHFVGIHAHQFVPLAGAAIVALGLPWAHIWVIGFSVVYGVIWLGLLT